MTKEEKIKEAYGNYYDRFKTEISNNGWLKVINGSGLYGSTLDYEQDKKREILKIVFYQRPKSLQGIENNNGWIKIESEADLPKDDGCYHSKTKDGDYTIGTMANRLDAVKKYWLENFTHYQLIETPKPPLY